MVKCTESSASIWQWLFTLLYRKHPLDQTREAKFVLQNAVSECDEAEKKITSDLKSIAKRVKEAQGAKNISNQTRSLLLNSRQKRKTLQIIQKKRIALQQQQETLESCELNEKVIKSMKQSSAVLKDAGLEQQMRGVDETMMDMQENMDMANQITNVLSDALSTDTEWNDDDMEKEFSILMEEDYYQPVDVPVLQNKMTPSFVQEDTEPPQIEPVQTEAVENQNEEAAIAG